MDYLNCDTGTMTTDYAHVPIGNGSIIGAYPIQNPNGLHDPDYFYIFHL